MSLDKANENSFYEPFLDFRLAKPASWRFQPAAWSPVARLKNAHAPGEEWLALANLPFVCCMGSHESQLEAYPTVQATARPSAIPNDDQARSLVDASVAFMNTRFSDFELLDSSIDLVVAGCRASLVRSRYTHFGGRDQEIEFGVLVRSYQIFSPGIAFTVGMSSSENTDYYREDDFQRVLESISIGSGA